MNPIDAIRTRFAGSPRLAELGEFLALEYPRESPTWFVRTVELSTQGAHAPGKGVRTPRAAAAEVPAVAPGPRASATRPRADSRPARPADAG